MNSRLPGLFALAFLILARPGIAQTPPPEVASFPDLSFAKVGDRGLLLDLIVPKTATRPPLVIYIHGGAWVESSRKENPMRWLADSGFAVASIDYRYSTEATFPAQIFDCKAAVRWLRAKAAKYGYNAEKIAVIGSSAGGHLAVLLGTSGGLKELEGNVGSNAGESSRVQAIVDYYGPIDFILRARTQPEMTDPPDSRVHRLLGVAPKDNEALAKLASGAYQVTPDDPPLLIFHGANDKTVLPNQSLRLRDAYQAAKLPVTFELVPNAEHQITPFLAPVYRKQVVEFLDRNLK